MRSLCTCVRVPSTAVACWFAPTSKSPQTTLPPDMSKSALPGPKTKVHTVELLAQLVTMMSISPPCISNVPFEAGTPAILMLRPPVPFGYSGMSLPPAMTTRFDEYGALPT